MKIFQQEKDFPTALHFFRGGWEDCFYCFQAMMLLKALKHFHLCDVTVLATVVCEVTAMLIHREP